MYTGEEVFESQVTSIVRISSPGEPWIPCHKPERCISEHSNSFQLLLIRVPRCCIALAAHLTEVSLITPSRWHCGVPHVWNSAVFWTLFTHAYLNIVMVDPGTGRNGTQLQVFRSTFCNWDTPSDVISRLVTRHTASHAGW